jgi:hypothetical protein
MHNMRRFMDSKTITVHLQDGCFQRIESPDAVLAHYRVAVVVDGECDRVAAMQLVLADAIERYVRGFRGCDLAGAWHGLDAARDELCGAARHSIEMAGELVADMHVPIATRLDRRDFAELLADTHDAGPLLDAAERSAERMLEAIRGLRAVRDQAAQTCRR